MTSTSHTDCPHPATKAARALCRKIRASQVRARAMEAASLIDSYYDNTGDFEEIICTLMSILPQELTTAYFESDADADELIALANTLRLGL